MIFCVSLVDDLPESNGFMFLIKNVHAWVFLLFVGGCTKVWYSQQPVSNPSGDIALAPLVRLKGVPSTPSLGA